MHCPLCNKQILRKIRAHLIKSHGYNKTHADKTWFDMVNEGEQIGFCWPNVDKK